MDFLIEEIQTDLDAFDIYSLFKDDKTVTLLDSGMGAENLGRYSFIGLNSFTNFKYQDNICIIMVKSFMGSLFKSLINLLTNIKFKTIPNFHM